MGGAAASPGRMAQRGVGMRGLRRGWRAAAWPASGRPGVETPVRATVRGWPPAAEATGKKI